MKYPNDNPETREYCRRMTRMATTKLLRWRPLDVCEAFTRRRIDQMFFNCYREDAEGFYRCALFQDEFGAIHGVPWRHPWLHVYLMQEEGVL